MLLDPQDIFQNRNLQCLPQTHLLLSLPVLGGEYGCLCSILTISQARQLTSLTCPRRIVRSADDPRINLLSRSSLSNHRHQIVLPSKTFLTSPPSSHTKQPLMRWDFSVSTLHVLP